MPTKTNEKTTAIVAQQPSEQFPLFPFPSPDTLS